MECCNRDEAIKAKVISEQKLTEHDFAGAKEFALKAQVLNPGTDGLSQLMVIINVYESAKKKVGGEVDWYGILGVSPAADHEDIKKQYRRIALMIHPDKNKCTGADGAFKLVLEACSLLSDKAKRYAYDEKRRIHNVPNSRNVFTNNRSSSSSCWNNAKPPPSNTTTSSQRIPTYFARCLHLNCMTYHELPFKYLDQTILCRGCHRPFKAVQRHYTLPGPLDIRVVSNVSFGGGGMKAAASAGPWKSNAATTSSEHIPTYFARCLQLNCMTYHELPFKYLNQTIPCSSCHQPFEAVLRYYTLPGPLNIRLASNVSFGGGGMKAAASVGPWKSNAVTTSSEHIPTYFARCLQLNCMTYHELPYKYLNQTILCSSCHQPFEAVLRYYTMPGPLTIRVASNFSFRGGGMKAAASVGPRKSDADRAAAHKAYVFPEEKAFQNMKRKSEQESAATNGGGDEWVRRVKVCLF